MAFRYLLNSLQEFGVTEQGIRGAMLALLAMLGLELAFWLTHGPSRVIEKIAAFKTDRNYREFLLNGALKLGLSWHSQRDSGDTIDKVNQSSQALFDFSSNSYFILGSIIKTTGTTIILLSFNPWVGILAILILVLAFISISQFDKKLIPQFDQLNKFNNKISARIFDSLSNITTIKVLNIEKPIFKKIKETLWTPRDLFKKNEILGESKWATGGILFKLILIIPIGTYLFINYRNNIVVQVGTISAMYMYLYNLLEVYYGLAGFYGQLIRNKTTVLNAAELEEDIIKMTSAKKKLPPKWNTLEITDTTFRYEDSQKKEQNINIEMLQIKRGEKIALIGGSGSGKSTFLKVFHGMYLNTSSMISFNDKTPVQTNFADIDLKTTLVPQEPEIFSQTIRENITLGVNYSQREIYNATDISRFTEVIKDLPKGLESVINEKGVNLSGGQKQRLALARALLFASKDKEILLLDESTSSVDPNNEVKIYQNIFKKFKGRTVIASIHKMNLLKYFDRIIIFKNGKIHDEGTFKDLLKNNPTFKKDWEEYIEKGSEA